MCVPSLGRKFPPVLFPITCMVASGKVSNRSPSAAPSTRDDDGAVSR